MEGREGMEGMEGREGMEGMKGIYISHTLSPLLPLLHCATAALYGTSIIYCAGYLTPCRCWPLLTLLLRGGGRHSEVRVLLHPQKGRLQHQGALLAAAAASYWGWLYSGITS